jgi:hypothetical protein
VNKPPAIQNDPAVLAILHRTGSVWRAMIVSTRAAQPAVVATREFARDQVVRIDGWLDEHKASQVLCVLPASCVICRNCALPDAAPEQLEQALRLQAEAHLLGMAPPHRLAMAVLPNAVGETSRNGLILAWPEAAEFIPPVNGSRPVGFVPDVAAIAALLNGIRPTEPLLWLDRYDGSVALALSHASGAVFRGTHEETESSEAWSRAVGRMVAETSLSVGHTANFIDSMIRQSQTQAASVAPERAALFVPVEAISSAASQAKGVSTDSSWWSQWGVIVGALLARTGPLRALTQLQTAPPIDEPSRIRSTLTTLSRPAVAARLAIACVVILALGPLVFSVLRLGVLSLRYGDLDKELADVKNYKAQAAIYEELQKQHVWPMTKLLGDIVSNAPEGIELEVIKVDGGQTFAVSGTSRSNDGKSPAEVVALMQENLRSSNQFQDVVLNWGQGNNMGVYKFDLSAKVAKPYKLVSYDTDRDFKLWTLQMRQAGDPRPTAGSAKPTEAVTVNNPPIIRDADPIVVEEQPTENPPDSALVDASQDEVPDEGDYGQGPRTRFRPTESSLTRGGETSGYDGARGDSAIPPQLDTPPPITQEQIDRLTKEEARSELYKRAVAERHITDKEVKERVSTERRLLIEHLKKRQ